MKVVTIANQKGGVGKSTTALALGLGLKKKGYKVLFVDLDSQGNLSFVFDALGYQNTAMDLLLRNVHVDDVLVDADLGDIIPSGKNLAVADVMITETGREHRLKEVLNPLKDKYDFIIVDTPPALGILTINALVYADYVVIPIQTDIFSLQGLETLNENINAIRNYYNPNLSIDGILLTQYNSRPVINRNVCTKAEEIAENIGTRVYNTKIRKCISLTEAQALRQNIFEYAPKSNASVDYMNFVNEFLEGK